MFLPCMRFLIAPILLGIIIGGADLTLGSSNCCTSCIQCPADGRCIQHTNLCDGIPHCENGEDESDEWCTTYKNTRCSLHQTSCSHSCVQWVNACSRDCRNYGYEYHDSRICSAFTSGKLWASLTPVTTPAPVTPPPVMGLQIDMAELASYVAVANCSLEEMDGSTHCPMLYTRVADTCVSFLPFKLTWPEAREACRSIAGELIEFHSVEVFKEVVQHIMNKDFSADFWTGGFYEIKKEAWTWSNGTKMPSSTPYWTLMYSEECAPRPSSSLGNHSGCFHYVQAPSSHEAGYCAALQFEHMYYISDQGCFDKKQPICVFTPREDTGK